MTRQYVALLRAISNVPMLPFREALEELGFTDVASYGMSGNLMFNAAESEVPSLESRIEERLGARTFVRTRDEITHVATSDPFRGRSGAAVLFLASPVDPDRMREIEGIEFEGDRPQIAARTIFFVYPTRRRGKRTPVDLEQIVGVQGTARSSKVVDAILARMSEP